MSEGVYGAYQNVEFSAPNFGRLNFSRALPGVAVAATSVFLFVWASYVRPRYEAPSAAPVSAPSPYGTLTFSNDTLRLGAVSPSEGHQFGALAPSAPPPAVAPARFAANDPFGGLADMQASVSWGSLALRPGFDPYADGESPPLPPQAPEVASLGPTNPSIPPPLPPRRPTDLGNAPAAQTASPPTSTEVQGPIARPNSGPDVPGFLAHLFSGGASAPTANPANKAVAYAAPETTTISRTTRDSGNSILRSFTPSAPPGALSAYDHFTAVYDIEARTVYLPNGTRLEAHSGYGELKDDPKNVAVRARGATPPDTYELTLRESLFHGVQALRLKPLGSGDPFGRNGLLAHPYMLGPDGDSNGCVSVKDYDAFLQAFESGQIKRLVVVAKL